MPASTPPASPGRPGGPPRPYSEDPKYYYALGELRKATGERDGGVVAVKVRGRTGESRWFGISQATLEAFEALMVDDPYGR